MDDCALYESAPAAFSGQGLASRTYSGVDIAPYLLSYTATPSWLNRARAKLDELGQLQAGWDSYGAKQVSSLARFAAFELLRQTATRATPAPALIPTSEGLVQIEWHTRGIDLEVLVISPTRFSVLFEDSREEADRIEEELRYDLRKLKTVIQLLATRVP